MSLHLRLSLACAGTLGAAAVAAGDLVEIHRDVAGDASLRRTDAGGDGPVLPTQLLPDLIELRVMNWQTASPTSDRFDGEAVNDDDAHLLRVDAVFVGLINPPGPLAVGQETYNPFCYGPSPLYGAIEFDVDRNNDTGGELTPVAQSRFLANAARFGGLPYGDAGPRAARWGADLDADWTTAPQYERSGADFALLFCGCSVPSAIVEGGDMDGVFDPGESWTIIGRYFQRSGGYTPASTIRGPNNSVGSYSPEVRVRFSHDQASDRTTVSLVYALDMTGAARLAGLPNTPPANDMVEIDGNSGSVYEALRDLVHAAGRMQTGLPRELVRRWGGRDAGDYLDTTRWQAQFLIGTAYAAPEDGLFAWTDVGFRWNRGDVDGDGRVSMLDRAAVSDEVDALDGGAADADGAANSIVVILDFPFNFSLYDINNDGLLNAADAASVPVQCPADWDGSGATSVVDLFAYLSSFFGGEGDMNGSGTTDVTDLFLFLAAWFAGCP